MEIIAIAAGVLGVYILTIMTWVMYIAIMSLAKVRDRLHPFAKFNAYFIILPVGYVLDATLNLIACVVFLRPPRDWLLTGTLKRMINTETGYREWLASWICTHLLDQFDPSGDHC
jgi:hypothetical protein